MIRCAVVGVGYLGRFHAQKYKLLDGVELVGVCDLNSEQGLKVASELSVPYFESYQELEGKVDAVTIAASTSAHFELAKFFLERGVHVHVEKPMTSTTAEAEELCRIARKKNLKLQVGHVERFNPALIAVKQKLKNPLFIECHRLAPFKPRSADVNIVLDVMIHDLDVIMSLVKSEVVAVSAIGTPVLTSTIDIANARIEFASGAIANVTASRVSQNTQRKFRVFQNSQYLSIDFSSAEVNLMTKTDTQPVGNIPIAFESWNLEKGDALLAETKAFVDAIRLDRPCEVSGEDGLVALKLAEQIMEAIAKRLQIRAQSRDLAAHL